MSVELIKERIQESIAVKQNLMNQEGLLQVVSSLTDAIVSCIKNDGKLVLCGNGGSASDALHFAGEVVGRFQKERRAWPAIVLNADVATMTAISNDYGYDDVYARQVEAFVESQDIFLGISTSGNSENICRAIMSARAKGAKTAALLGKDGGRAAKLADYPMIVPSRTTARVQESHIMLIHIICEIMEEKLQ